jgi:hypothetical protein
LNQRPSQNIAASIRQRLLNLAHEQGEEFQFILTRYGLERLLYRLSLSPNAEDFLLKGAMLFAAWSDQIHRPTLDLDLAGRGNSSLRYLEDVFRDLCRMDFPEDGLIFDQASVKAAVMRELQQYPGARILLTAHLSGARLPLRVDIGFGDAVVPAPVRIEYPCLLDQAAPTLNAYPQEAVIAEKFHIMVFLGMANTRMKDFYDLWWLARSFRFAGTDLIRAIQATFERRKTPIPTEKPIAFTAEFYENAGKRAAWQAFLTRNRLPYSPVPLSEACSLLDQFLSLLSRTAAARESFDTIWNPPGPWQERPTSQA